MDSFFRDIKGGRAQELRPESWRALLSTARSAALFFTIALLAHVFVRALSSIPGTNIKFWQRPPVGQSRSLRRQSQRGIWQQIRSVCAIDRDYVLRRHGLEALLFLRFLRFMFVLSLISALVLFPTMASFTHFIGKPGIQPDFLNSLSWSNLSESDDRAMWLYSALVPLIIGGICYAMTQQLSSSLMACKAFPKARKVMEGPQSGAYSFAAIHGSEDLHEISNTLVTTPRLRKWIYHFIHISPEYPSTNELKTLTTKIEKEESLFSRKLIQRARHLSITEFQQCLESEILRRYVEPPAEPRFGRSEHMPTLYKTLRDKVATINNASRRPSTSTVKAVVMTFLDQFTASLVIGHLRRFTQPSSSTSFLGSRPGEILFQNLVPSWRNVQITRIFIRLIIVLLIILWTVPMAAVGSLSQISSLQQLTGFWHLPDSILGVLQGLIPSLATSILLSIFPIWLRNLICRSHRFTMAEIEISVARYYFVFLFVQLFLVATISSAIIPTTFEIVNHGVIELPQILARNVPLAGNYYLSYLLVHGVLLAASTLLPLKNLALTVYTYFTAVTPRQRAEAHQNMDYDFYWGDLYAFYGLLVTIVLTYSVLTPMILPIAALTFGIADLCFRYRLETNSRTVADTEGLIYRSAMLKMFVGIYICQFTFLGLFILRTIPRREWSNVVQLFIIGISLLCTTQFHIYLSRRFSVDTWKAGYDSYGLNDQEVSTEESVDREDLLTKIEDAQRTIWLRKDQFGISTAMKQAIETNCLSDKDDVLRIRTLTQ